MKIVLFILIAFLLPFSAYASDDYWVTSDRLDRRTCPNENCGIVGQLFYREKAVVYETKGNWVRITKPYPGMCENGLSQFVDKGNAVCTKDNGFSAGKFSEWVKKDQLSKTRPEDPAKNATGDYLLVKDSDDYKIYKDAFVKATLQLIKDGKCSRQDFLNFGGWLKSPQYNDSPVYFTNCGSGRAVKKFYLNAATGNTFN